MHGERSASPPETIEAATARHFCANAPTMASFISPRVLRALLLGASLGVLMPGATPVLAQTVANIAGTSVGIAPPKGMTPSTTFAGYESAETGASILVSELPLPAYPEIAKAFTPAGLATSGLKASGDAIDWKVAGGSGGRLIRGKQTANDQEYRKWILLAKSPTNTVMLTVQVPESKSSDLPDVAIENALKTVAVRPTPALSEQIATLPFKVGDLVNFRAVQVFGGSGLLLTDGPKDIIPDASQPVVIVASSLSKVAAQDQASREALARKAFENFAGVSDLTVVAQSMTEKNGVVWSRMEGIGTYRKSLEALATLQLIRFDNKGGYIRVVAVANKLHRDNVIPRVEMLADSIVPK